MELPLHLLKLKVPGTSCRSLASRKKVPGSFFGRLASSVGLGVVFLLGNLSTISVFAKDWAQIYESAKPAVPILVMSGGYCSGTLIEKDLILTAAHCVASLRQISVTWSAKIGDFQEGKVVGMNKEADIALVRLSAPRSEVPIKIIAKEKGLKVGEGVATIGHPSQPDLKWGSSFPFTKDETYLISSGVVSGLTDDDLITDLSLTPGNSGGPILNADGELVAVVSRKRVGPAVGAIGFATSRTKIYELLDSLKKEGDRVPSIWSAKTGVEFAITFTDGNLAQTERNSRFWSSGFEFRLAAWDRLYLGYTGSFNGQPRYSSLMFGPKFQCVTNSSHVWIFSPQVEYATLKYTPEPIASEVSENLWAYSLYVRTTRFPFAFKAGYIPRKGNAEYFWNIQLPIF